MMLEDYSLYLEKAKEYKNTIRPIIMNIIDLHYSIYDDYSEESSCRLELELVKLEKTLEIFDLNVEYESEILIAPIKKRDLLDRCIKQLTNYAKVFTKRILMNIENLEANFESIFQNEFLEIFILKIIFINEGNPLYSFLVTAWNDFFCDSFSTEILEDFYLLRTLFSLNLDTLKHYGDEIVPLSIDKEKLKKIITSKSSRKAYKFLFEDKDSSASEKDIEYYILEAFNFCVERNNIYILPNSKDLGIRAKTCYDGKIFISDEVVKNYEKHKMPGRHAILVKTVLHEIAHYIRMVFICDKNYLDSTWDGTPIDDQNESGAIYEKFLFGSYLSCNLIDDEMGTFILDENNYDKEDFIELSKKNLLIAFCKYKRENYVQVVDCHKPKSRLYYKNKYGMNVN